VLILEFKAVPDAGVVAGGNDDGPAGFFRQNAVADDWRRRGFRGKVGFDAVPGDYFRGGGGEVLGGKPGIVPDDQPAVGQPRFFKVIGDSLGAVADVFKGEILGNDRPPAVRAELDGISFFYLPHPLHSDYKWERTSEINDIPVGVSEKHGAIAPSVSRRQDKFYSQGFKSFIFSIYVLDSETNRIAPAARSLHAIRSQLFHPFF
jgi:hypothetical protein